MPEFEQGSSAVVRVPLVFETTDNKDWARKHWNAAAENKPKGYILLQPSWVPGQPDTIAYDYMRSDLEDPQVLTLAASVVWHHSKKTREQPFIERWHNTLSILKQNDHKQNRAAMSHAQMTRQQVFLPPHTTCQQPGTQRQLTYGAGVNPQGRVENYVIDSQYHRVHGFFEGTFPTTAKCAAGSAGIDGTCVCPASANSAPFADNPLTPHVMKEYFSITGPVRNDLTPEARYLVAQRRPQPLGNRQPNLDGFYSAAY
jgi:hypothetical protein